MMSKPVLIPEKMREEQRKREIALQRRQKMQELAKKLKTHASSIASSVGRETHKAISKQYSVYRPAIKREAVSYMKKFGRKSRGPDFLSVRSISRPSQRISSRRTKQMPFF